MTTPPSTPADRRSRRPLAAAFWFGIAVLIAGYWIAQVLRVAEFGSGAGWWVESGYLLVVGATMALLPALAGTHYLDAVDDAVERRDVRWRLPVAGMLAGLGLVLAPLYGFGLYASIGGVVIMRRERRDGPLAVTGRIIRVAAWVGVVAGAGMTIIAIGLCGPAIIGGVCNA